MSSHLKRTLNFPVFQVFFWFWLSSCLKPTFEPLGLTVHYLECSWFYSFQISKRTSSCGCPIVVNWLEYGHHYYLHTLFIALHKVHRQRPEGPRKSGHIVLVLTSKFLCTLTWCGNVLQLYYFCHVQLLDGETVREWMSPAYLFPDGSGFSYPWELRPLGKYTLRGKDGIINGYNSQFTMAVSYTLGWM